MGAAADTRVSMAWRYFDGTFMRESEKSEVHLAEYERYARGGRARAARADDGTFDEGVNASSSRRPNMNGIWQDTFDCLFAGPTFATLIRHEGKLDTKRLRREIERKLVNVLTDADHESYQSEKGKDAPKWWVDIRAQAERWRKNGFILDSKDSGRGIWQIAEKGRRSFEINKDDFIARGWLKPNSDWELTDLGRKSWKEFRYGR